MFSIRQSMPIKAKFKFERPKRANERLHHEIEKVIFAFWYLTNFQRADTHFNYA